VYARCAFTNARCALFEPQNDSERKVQREQRKLDIPGARTAHSLESANFEEITKKNARWAWGILFSRKSLRI
jgi:hypothetical protein